MIDGEDGIAAALYERLPSHLQKARKYFCVILDVSFADLGRTDGPKTAGLVADVFLRRVPMCRAGRENDGCRRGPAETAIVGRRTTLLTLEEDLEKKRLRIVPNSIKITGVVHSARYRNDAT